MKLNLIIVLILSLAATTVGFRFKRQSILPLQAVLEGKPPKFVDGLNQGGLGPDPFFNPQGGLYENGVPPPPPSTTGR